MKLVKLVSASALSLLLGTLLLGTTALTYAQEQRDEAKPEPEARPEATKPAPDEMKSPRQDEAKPQKPDEEKDKAAGGNDKAAKQEKQESEKSSKQAEHAGQSGDRTQRTADTHSVRIPDDKFRAHFGRQHKFVVKRTVVNGQPRFQYGGFWFTVVDVWPAGWVDSDEYYIDDVDGEYFLFDLAHPGVRIAVIVVA
jgi:hypothetical protein